VSVKASVYEGGLFRVEVLRWKRGEGGATSEATWFRSDVATVGTYNGSACRAIGSFQGCEEQRIGPETHAGFDVLLDGIRDSRHRRWISISGG